MLPHEPKNADGLKTTDAPIATRDIPKAVHTAGQLEITRTVNVDGLSGLVDTDPGEYKRQIITRYEAQRKDNNRIHDERRNALLKQIECQDSLIEKLETVNETCAIQQNLLDPLKHILLRAFVDELIQKHKLSGTKRAQRLKLASMYTGRIPFSGDQIKDTVMFVTKWESVQAEHSADSS
jgi:hypothetical protein